MPNLRSKTWTTTTPATVNDAQYWEDHLISDADAQKAANSVQSVNGTPPDASGNVDVVALPAGGTTGQVLTKISNTSGDADWRDPASGGHAIQDDDGTTMTQQPTLQFVNADVTNDSVNSKTVVDCKGAKGDAATVTVGNTSTLPAGSSATVTNSGTTSAAVFNFGIPAGADGQDGTDGADGVSVTGVVLESTSGKVKTYRMSFSDGNYFDYDVTDGADGTGAGDMLSTDYDPNNDVYNAGGIPNYVSGVLPVITNTYSATSDDGMSGKAVASAVSGKADTSSLKDLAYIDKDGVSSTKYLRGDGTWQAMPTVDQTYSSVSINAQSGTAVAGAIVGKLNGKVFGTATSSDGTTVTFSNIDTSKGYILQADLPNNYGGAPVGMSNIEITSSGGVYSVTYTVTNATVNMSFDLIEIG